MSRNPWLIPASCSVIVLLAACQGVPGSTSESLSTPGPCTTSDVRVIVGRFIDAFNRGDLAQLDQVVSDQQFSWYSTDAPGQRFNEVAKDRSTLIAYFAARHQQHELLVLRTLDVTYTDATTGGFWFRLTRSADDGLPPTAYNGKGAIQCTTMPKSLTTWAMDPLPWSPIELLPQAAAVLLLVAAICGIFLWRRRSAQRHVRVGA
jgi:hypothetical protein